MSNTDTNEKAKFSHYTFTTRGIFKGITKNTSGTYFAEIAIPTGQVNNKQAYNNVSAIVSNSAALQSLASSMCDLEINQGKGTSAEVTLSDMRASNAFDKDGNVRLDKNNVPFINFSAFLNEIAFK